ncbi:hypothetical protein Taro_054808, partial [Colocasia esculenta]|nr:hypothetical protein [Colocasia esculenta]
MDTSTPEGLIGNTNSQTISCSQQFRTYNSNTGVRVSRTDDTDLNGTTLYRDKLRAQQTHVPGSQRTWGTRLERHSGIGAGPPHSASTKHDIYINTFYYQL